jgi:hypothetical protein
MVDFNIWGLFFRRSTHLLHPKISLLGLIHG